MTNMFGLKNNGSEVLIIQKSKFLSFAFVVSTEEEVKEHLLQLKKQYYDATHICYAYDLMDNRQKCYDDGEPQGTAGKPILDCIKKQNLKNVLVVVVRYFGGIKLGAGGLTRAYSSGASLVIKNIEKKEIELCYQITFNILPNEVSIFQSLTKLEFVKDIKIEFLSAIQAKVICSDDKQILDYLKNLFKREIEILSKERLYF